MSIWRCRSRQTWATRIECSGLTDHARYSAGHREALLSADGPVVRIVAIFVVAHLLLVESAPVWAQFGDVQPAAGPQMGESTTTKWKVGMIARAVSGPCTGLVGTVPVPIDWPEQQVRVVNEEISPAVKRVQYTKLGNGARQMSIRIPTLRAGEVAQALVTFEIDRHVLLPPENPEAFQLPKSIPADVRTYILPSPQIEVRDAKIVALAKELRDDQLSAWAQVETIYDDVRARVEYKNGPLKGAVAALRDGHGDCEELTSLFIALCRANKIPARTVWVPDHCYPEFYLVDAEGTGFWFPCQAAGTRDFGGNPDTRPILQKGDNFRVPGKRERQRYAAESLTGKGGRPSIQFVRQIVTN